jgi:hypothetical protein
MTKEIRFEAKVDRSGDCHIWTGATDKDGYGRFYWDRNKPSIPAYQAAWILANGPIPQGLEPDHLCRNRLCVRVEHLELVTSQINTTRALAKLTEDQVRQIRTDLTNGVSKASLARIYGVSFMTIKHIQIGKNYKWVV